MSLHPVQTQPAFYWHTLALAAGMKDPFAADPEDLRFEGYHIWVDAKNGSDTHTGLWESVPVKTLMRAGEVLKLLPNDARRALGVRIWLRASVEGDPATYYRDYLDKDGAPYNVPQSPFQGQNNFWIATNPKDANVAVFDGSFYDRRSSFYKNAGPLRPQALYLQGNNITLKRLKFRGVAGDAVFFDGNGGHFSGLTFERNEAVGLYVRGGSSLVEYVYVHHHKSVRSPGYFATGIRAHQSSGVTLRYCVAHSNEFQNIDLHEAYDVLIYLCDAFEAGYYSGLGSAPYPQNYAFNFALGAPTAGIGNSDVVFIGNRAWNAAKQNITTERTGRMRVLHNVSYDSDDVGFKAEGYSNVLLANNIAYNDPRRIISSDGGVGNTPVAKGNSWQQSSSVTGSDFESMTRVVPETGVDDRFLMPKASEFGGASSFDAGFGRDIGPTRAVRALLRSLTPEEIRARARAVSF